MLVAKTHASAIIRNPDLLLIIDLLLRSDPLATLRNDPGLAPLAISMAKAYASDSYREVGNLGIQVHGGIGFTWDHEIHFYYKRSKASELMFGDALYHRERIARIVMDGAVGSSRVSARAGD